MQLAIFLRRKFVAPHRLELGLALEPVAGGNIARADGKAHHRIERTHFGLAVRAADQFTQTALASLASPCRIIGPVILTDRVNLRAANIIVQNPAAALGDSRLMPDARKVVADAARFSGGRQQLRRPDVRRLE